jgi:hypothetical protein
MTVECTITLPCVTFYDVFSQYSSGIHIYILDCNYTHESYTFPSSVVVIDAVEGVSPSLGFKNDGDIGKALLIVKDSLIEFIHFILFI